MATNPKLEVFYPETNQTGPISRCDIDPPPPAPITNGMELKVVYDKEIWKAVAKESWTPPPTPPKKKTGRRTKIKLYFIDAAIRGPVMASRAEIIPKNEEIRNYDLVQHKFRGKYLKALALEAWRPVPAKVRYMLFIL